MLTRQRLVHFAESKGAIIVSPNYRLLPEATGKDIVEDLSNFYGWMKTSLPKEVSKMSSGVEANLSNILVAGESAGKTSRRISWINPVLTIRRRRSCSAVRSSFPSNGILRYHLTVWND